MRYLVLLIALMLITLACARRASQSPQVVQRMDSNTPFKTLLAKANDFDLVNGTYIKIDNIQERKATEPKCSPEGRIIILVWQSSGVIDNGGFEYLFESEFDGDPEFRLTAEAYKTVGLTLGYEAFQEAFKLFPEGRVPRDRTQRMQQYQKVDNAVRDKVNKMFWREGWENIREKKLAQYIRDNVSKFGDVDSYDGMAKPLNSESGKAGTEKKLCPAGGNNESKSGERPEK